MFPRSAWEHAFGRSASHPSAPLLTPPGMTQSVKTGTFRRGAPERGKTLVPTLRVGTRLRTRSGPTQAHASHTSRNDAERQNRDVPTRSVGTRKDPCSHAPRRNTSSDALRPTQARASHTSRNDAEHQNRHVPTRSVGTRKDPCSHAPRGNTPSDALRPTQARASHTSRNDAERQNRDVPTRSAGTRNARCSNNRCAFAEPKATLERRWPRGQRRSGSAGLAQLS